MGYGLEVKEKKLESLEAGMLGGWKAINSPPASLEAPQFNPLRSLSSINLTGQAPV
jgi:hypothetical protein